MTYTEIKKRNERKYYYRVLSVRKNDKISKKREYLGVNLNRNELNKKEAGADKVLNIKNKRETEEIRMIKRKIIGVLKKYNIKKAGIFGSYADGTQKKDSDVDILVLPAKGMGIEFVGLEIELSKKLNRKVDLVSYNGLSPFLKERILKQEVRII